MGVTSSKLEKALGEFPESERYFGLENFGNTCYANSVLQSLYFCQPFRRQVLEYAQSSSYKESDENLLTCLADLFVQIHSQKRKAGVIAPKRFVQRLRKDNELFRGYMHQDAHEFLNYLLNECSELLEKEAKARAEQAGVPSSEPAQPGSSPGQSLPQESQQAAEGQPGREEMGTSSTGTVNGSDSNGNGNGNSAGKAPPTWVHDLFQGTLVNETRCLECETVTSREEAFYDLSLEIEQNCSLTACLRNFSAMETLDADDKFFCDKCNSLQDAQKWMKIKALPQVLCLHLKRFKYIEQLDRMRKLMYRVVFPFELKLRNTSEDCPNADDMYHLFAVVVHVGSGPNHGHYVSFVKSHEHWLFFDDDLVEPITAAMVQSAFGSTQDYASNMDQGYILMYERRPSNGDAAS